MVDEKIRFEVRHIEGKVGVECVASCVFEHRFGNDIHIDESIAACHVLEYTPEIEKKLVDQVRAEIAEHKVGVIR